MAQKRPAAVTAMGVLNLVFGGMNLLGLCVGGGVLLLLVILFVNLPAPPGQPSLREQLGGLFQDFDREAPAAKYLIIASVVFTTVMAAVLIVAGVGLLRMRHWGRTLSLVYAAAMLIYGPASAAYFSLDVAPRWQRLQQKFVEQQAARKPTAAPPPAMVGPELNAVQAVMGAVMHSLYPIALLVVLNLRPVREAFARPAGRDGPEPAPPEVNP
jgi:hypothetical protein